MKRFLRVAVPILLFISIFCGCSDDTRTFQKGDLSIKLPSYFEDRSNESYAKSYDFLYTYGGTGFLGICEKRSDFPSGYEKMDLEAYGKFVIYGNNLSCELTKRDGVYTFTYEKDAPEGKLTYIAIVLETEDAFWTVQAYCLSKFYLENASLMWECLKSAKVQ